jgi:uncharacterized protein YjiS (DUF1127 family)
MSTMTGSALGRIVERRSTSPIAWIGTVLAALRTWNQRAIDRRHLLELDDHLLHDLGLTRDQVYYESRKPFWRS